MKCKHLGELRAHRLGLEYGPRAYTVSCKECNAFIPHRFINEFKEYRDKASEPLGPIQQVKASPWSFIVGFESEVPAWPESKVER